jgi:hypothetical protein
MNEYPRNFNSYEVNTDKIPYYDNLPLYLTRRRGELKKKWKIEQQRLRLLFKKDLEIEFKLQNYKHKKMLWNFAVWTSDPVSEDHYNYKYIYHFYKTFKKLIT